MQKTYEEQNDEHQKLINGDHRQHQASSLEWAESSWTRWLHLLCWWWINPILSKGYNGSLCENDLNDLPHSDKSSILLNRLRSYDWTSTPTWKIIIKEFWKEYIYAGLFYFPFLISRVAQPLLARQIVLDIMNKQQSFFRTYLCAILLSVCAIITGLCYRQANFRPMRVAVRIRNALTGVIYTRSLSMKSAIWQQMNTGQIINLVANDTKKFEDAFAYMHYLWEGFLEAIIIFGVLCWLMKPIPTLICYAVLISFVVIQLLIGRKLGEYRGITASCCDKRVHAFNEFIHGCHIIKMYNWETLMEDQIRQMRQNELASIRRASTLRAFNMSQYFLSTPLLALATLSSAWLLGYSLNVVDTFTALSFFGLTRTSFIYYFSSVIEQLNEAQLASKRIDAFMHLGMQEENKCLPSTSSINKQQKGKIFMLDASFSWSADNPCLSLLNLIIEPGSLVGVVGPVGSGKSSLLTVILGEMNLTNGQFDTNGSSFAYAAQSPWIFADTLRNNILLNQTFDEQRYQAVIYACCLDVDLSLLGSSGDLTMIGERGVNLSGGQKARVSLARTLYTDADIYLVDDPLAAVDRTVAKQIYERCIGPHGLLKNKTRLLVTHQTQFLKEAHQIISLSYGHIIEQDHLKENMITKDDVNKEEPSLLATMLDDNIVISDTEPIITEETTVSGNASWSVWYRLFTAPPSGIFSFCLLIATFLLSEILYDGTNYWLSIGLAKSHTDRQHLPKFVYIYFGLAIATVLVNLFCTHYFFRIILHGTNYLHNNMLKALLHTSIQFFESNPSGRILNRASKDQQIIDEMLPRILLDAVLSLLTVVGSIIMICFFNPYVLLLFVVLIPIFFWVCYIYLRSSRPLKRLESITRSPVYDLFGSSLNGAITIRAFEVQDHFIQLLTDRIDINTSAYIDIQAGSQWVGLRLELITSLFLFVTAILVILFRNQIQPSMIALSLMYAVSIASWPQWTIRQLIEVDIMMTSAERIDEYAQLSSEEDQGGYQRLVLTSPKWPTGGTIDFRNYSLRHRSGLESVLKNINIHIESGQKIGIIGRTGAGKSSLFKGIFRLIHRSNIDGEILIDSIDISRITLNHLRSHLSIIPQLPILFSGTLRYNLDPFNHYSDEQCWMALEDVQLKPFVSSHSTGLLMIIAESGANLSVGQCQLICIARAILKKSKILLIDEATANIDQATDEIIQAVIADKFQDRTVLSIAHRLNTVAKSDRIIVLDKGIIVNFDTPMNILRYYQ